MRNSTKAAFGIGALGVLLLLLGVLVPVFQDMQQRAAKEALQAYVVGLETRLKTVSETYPAKQAATMDRARGFAKAWSEEDRAKINDASAALAENGIPAIIQQVKAAQADPTLGDPYQIGKPAEEKLTMVEAFVATGTGYYDTLKQYADMADQKFADAQAAYDEASVYIDGLKDSLWSREHQVEFVSAYAKLTEANTQLEATRTVYNTVLEDDFVKVDKVKAFHEASKIDPLITEARQLASNEDTLSREAFRELNAAEDEILGADRYILASFYNVNQATAELSRVRADYDRAYDLFWGNTQTGVKKDYAAAKNLASTVQYAAYKASLMAATPTPTFTPSATFTASATFTPSPTYTATPIPSNTPWPTARPVSSGSTIIIVDDDDDGYWGSGSDDSGFDTSDNDDWFGSDDSDSGYDWGSSSDSDSGSSFNDDSWGSNDGWSGSDSSDSWGSDDGFDSSDSWGDDDGW